MELDLRLLAHGVRRRTWGIVLFVLCCTVATGVLTHYYLKPLYQASTKLIVTRPADAAQIAALDINTVNMNIKLIDTYKEIIRTPAIMDAVIRENPQFGLTAEQLIAKVRVASVNETPVMSVTVQDGSYERAVQIANAVARVFRSQIPLIMKVDNVTILNEARADYQPEPVSPALEANLVIAACVSLLAAIVFAVIREMLDDTLKSEEDVAANLGIPLLAVVVDIGRKDLVRRKLRQRRMPTSGSEGEDIAKDPFMNDQRFHEPKAGDLSHASIN